MQRAHRYAIGDDIELIPRAASPKDAAGAYRITRLLPNDAQDREYRVKSGADGHERVVRESEMRPAPTTLLTRTFPANG